MNRLEQLHWPLIVGMGALALVWPFMNLSGLMDALGRPAGPLLLIALISATWLAIVVLGNVREPLLTLLFTGLIYGIVTLVLSALLSTILAGQLSGPFARPAVLPFAIPLILTTNVLWGGVVGLVAHFLQQSIHSGNQ